MKHPVVSNKVKQITVFDTECFFTFSNLFVKQTFVIISVFDMVTNTGERWSNHSVSNRIYHK